MSVVALVAPLCLTLLTCGNGMMRQFSCRTHDQHCSDLQCRTVAGATPYGGTCMRNVPRGVGPP
jgi:hypothetical protein